MHDIAKFINDQLSVWPLAAANFRSLKTMKVKEIKVGNIVCRAQHNPSRIASSTADVRAEAIAARPCFLCEDNRPPEQYHLLFDGRKGRRYHIQVNPYPIFPGHLVIVRDEHIPQVIWHHLPDMLDFVREYPAYTVFYNGPESGASAPDHLHFQAAPRHLMPLEEAVDAFLDNPGEPLDSVRDARVYAFRGYVGGVFALKADTSKSLSKMFYRFLDACGNAPGEVEPKFNLFVFTKGEEYRAFVILRSRVRSHHYDSEGADHLTMSPGAADMAGVLVAPLKEDFDKLDSAIVESMLSEVTISEEAQERIERRLRRRQPKVDVGIMSAPEIRFEIISDGAGPQTVKCVDGRIDYNGVLYDELYFDGMTRSTIFAEPSFILYDVPIGIDFHWSQKRTFKYAGGLKFIAEGGNVLAINHVGMEHYLLSVISSEMKSSCALESLKAHAVISRSWLVRRMDERAKAMETGDFTGIPHTLFDVCADDHCQRYQGLTMAVGDRVRQAIDETWGEVLRYDGQVCDTRYSKCCGGRTEIFSTCWEDRDYPYLRSVEDPYCDCENSAILSTVLNDYDLETRDFHDWTVRYTVSELSELVRSRSGRDFGEIESLEPIERGPSGRIKYLKIKGSKLTDTIGKELAIRRILSPSHLKSSAFEVERDSDGFTLKGHGWGHGVGLCQIGAAVMADKGFSYKEILSHYYPSAVIENLKKDESK